MSSKSFPRGRLLVLVTVSLVIYTVVCNAQSEAPRPVNSVSPDVAIQAEASAEDHERRLAFAWPKSLDPRNLSPKNWLRGGKNNDKDPFVQARSAKSIAVASRDDRGATPGVASYSDRQGASPYQPNGPSRNGPRNPPRLDHSKQREAPAISKSLESTDVIAMVGDHPILAGDLLGQINEALQPYVNQATAAELDAQRSVMMKQFLPQLIDAKLMYLEFERSIPAEGLPEVKQNVSKYFMEKELPDLIKRAKVDSAKELDAKLRSFGSSLEKQKRMFIERVFASQARAKNIKNDEEVTHEQMLNYYRDHLADYEYPSKAKWERLMVSFEQFNSKQDAHRAIARMGDQVRFGASLQEVAKRESQGSDAPEGGYHDWTTQGSLVSEKLDRAIFELPLNRLSRIIEDEKGFHIVRVLERQEAGRVSFQEAQAKIIETIKDERFQGKVQTYLAELRGKTRIWTVFDGETDDTSRIARPSPGIPQPF